MKKKLGLFIVHGKELNNLNFIHPFLVTNFGFKNFGFGHPATFFLLLHRLPNVCVGDKINKKCLQLAREQCGRGGCHI